MSSINTHKTEWRVEMNSKKKIVAITLIIVAFLLWGGTLIVPFINILGTAEKAAVIGTMLIAGEAILWVGVLIAGSEVMKRYRHKLSPKNWFKKSDISDNL